MFGLDPTLIRVRRSRFTYGVSSLNRFVAGLHPPEKRVVRNGIAYYAGVFDKFVAVNEPVQVGDSIVRLDTPARRD